MTYEEFFQIVCDTNSRICPDGSRVWYDGNENEFVIEWDDGGYEGGNCWGDEAIPYPGDPEPELDITDLLDKICPNITFIQYRKVINDLDIEYDSRYRPEYYGNCSQIGIKKIKYRNLYDVLKKHEII